MKIKHFTYTKDSGEFSDRRVLLLAEPHSNYFGLDLSNLEDDGLDESDIETLVTGLEELEQERKTLINSLGFSKRYRNFKPSGITWTSE